MGPHVYMTGSLFSGFLTCYSVIRTEGHQSLSNVNLGLKSLLGQFELDKKLYSVNRFLQIAICFAKPNIMK